MPELMAAPKASSGSKNKGGAYVDRDKPTQIRFSNINAAKGKSVIKLNSGVGPGNYYCFLLVLSTYRTW